MWTLSRHLVLSGLESIAINAKVTKMENKLAKYGVAEPVNRPKIKPTKQLDLSTPEGQRLVYSEAKLILSQHKNTFKRLAAM